MVKINFDGLCEPKNPGGHGAWGFVICYDGQKIKQSGYLGEGQGITNNYAEYMALINSLKSAIELSLGENPVLVCGDSQLVINQMTGKYAVRSPRIVPLWERANILLREFKEVKFSKKAK